MICRKELVAGGQWPVASEIKERPKRTDCLSSKTIARGCV